MDSERDHSPKRKISSFNRKQVGDQHLQGQTLHTYLVLALDLGIVSVRMFNVWRSAGRDVHFWNRTAADPYRKLLSNPFAYYIEQLQMALSEYFPTVVYALRRGYCNCPSDRINRSNHAFFRAGTTSTDRKLDVFFCGNPSSWCFYLTMETETQECLFTRELALTISTWSACIRPLRNDFLRHVNNSESLALFNPDFCMAVSSCIVALLKKEVSI